MSLSVGRNILHGTYILFMLLAVLKPRKVRAKPSSVTISLLVAVLQAALFGNWLCDWFAGVLDGDTWPMERAALSLAHTKGQWTRLTSLLLDLKILQNICICAMSETYKRILVFLLWTRLLVHKLNNSVWNHISMLCEQQRLLSFIGL